MTATRTLAASLIAAFTLATPLTATAADLYGENDRYQDRQSYDEPPYDEDRRYAEPHRRGGDAYGDERYDQPQYRYRGSAKDGEYLPPLDHPPRFSESRPDGRYGCAPRWQVRNRLQADGWSNFQRLSVRSNIVVLRADRRDGRAFDIKVDRCSGEIVDQRPARFQGYGAYGPGPRRYGPY